MKAKIETLRALGARLAVGGVVLAGSGSALAATAADAAIATAQSDALAIAGALLGLGVAVWGAMYLKRKFFP